MKEWRDIRVWNEQVFPFKKICKCGNCRSGITAEVKYRVLKSGKVNTHIYYHCCHSKDSTCREPYMTEKEMIDQLISYLPDMKLDKKYMIREFKDEIKRVSNMRKVIENGNYKGVELTIHKKKNMDYGISDDMVREYLLHILQFGTAEERVHILEGIKSEFLLSGRRLIII